MTPQTSPHPAIPPSAWLLAFLLQASAVVAVAQVAPAPGKSESKPAAASDRTASNRDATKSTFSPPAEETTVLSPFEVVAESRGYFSANTMSGTRLNSRIEDLGMSISVVTKEQMADFALLDINDIFNYEASTEGTGNYSARSFDQNGFETDAVQLTPESANRIRGLNSANISFGNFETSGAIPLDPLNIDAIEISRGPNSSLFGLGTGGGTVNSVPSSANLARDRSEVSLRGDHIGGYRSTLDLNRTLKRGVLAVRGSAAFQHDAFTQKPSGTDTVRLNGMVKFRPYPTTTLTASVSSYRAHGTRPNTGTPPDAITGWIQSGSPTWDPVTRTVKIGGRTIGTFSGVPPYFAQRSSGSLSQFYIDQGGIAYWGSSRTTTLTNPLTASGTGALMLALADPNGFLASQPLFTTQSVLNSKAYYDWTSINLAAANRFETKALTSTVLFEQLFLENQTHRLGIQLGWFRERTGDLKRIPLSEPRLAGANGRNQPLQVDVNERFFDGSPNPFFLRPFITSGSPGSRTSALNRDIYRAQFAYRLDLRQRPGWARWLGMHDVSGYYEYKEINTKLRVYSDALVSSHPWLGLGVARGSNNSALGGLPAGSPVSIGFYNFYLGDGQGYKVQYGSTPYDLGTYDIRVGNPTTGFVTERATLGSAAINLTNTGVREEYKAPGAILQSHWLKGRLVTTFGWREDARYRKVKAPLRLLSDGATIDPSSDVFPADDWLVGQGNTTTAGAVVKATSWLNLYANKSNSFTPAALAQNVNLKTIPDPRGQGHDYGVMLNLLKNRLFVRVNQYQTEQESRSGSSSTLANRLFTLDLQPGGSRLREVATTWITQQATASGQKLSTAQFNDRLATVMKAPLEYVTLEWPLTIPLSGMDRVQSRGTEVELNYNPTGDWTIKLNAVQQETINQSLSSETWKFYEDRLAVWQSLIDPFTGRPWFTSTYNNSEASADTLARSMTAISTARALEGKSLPQVRKYRLNFLTSFKLRAITDQRHLKRISVGGAVRWEDKGAIGFYGVQTLPAIITQLDVNRPVYDQSHAYIDLNANYRTRIFRDRVGLLLQCNARNLTEGGRLQPIAANPDGSPNAFRIIESRRYLFTATFEL